MSDRFVSRQQNKLSRVTSLAKTPGTIPPARTAHHSTDCANDGSNLIGRCLGRKVCDMALLSCVWFIPPTTTVYIYYVVIIVVAVACCCCCLRAIQATFVLSSYTQSYFQSYFLFVRLLFHVAFIGPSKTLLSPTTTRHCGRAYSITATKKKEERRQGQ